MDILYSTPPEIPAPTERSPRKPASSDGDKVEALLAAIKKEGWNLPKFLAALFNWESLPVKKRPGCEDGIESSTSLRRNTLRAFFNGTSRPHAGAIIDKMYQYSIHIPFRNDDPTIPRGLTFQRGQHFTDIEHAQPALAAWAVSLVSSLVHDEGGVMIEPETGLHMRAKSKSDNRRVTWAAVNSFSFHSLQKKAETHAPILWQVLSSYARSSEAEDIRNAGVIAVRRRRPQNLVATSAVMALTASRSQYASLYPLCRGIWLFAVKSHQSIFRVESRLGHSVAYSTVYDALKTMSDEQLIMLKELFDPESGRYAQFVSDNVQAYALIRDPRIGRDNRMIKGLAGTVVEMENVVPGAFDLKELIRRQALQERKKLSTELDNGLVARVTIIPTRPVFHVRRLFVRYRLYLRSTCNWAIGATIMFTTERLRFRAYEPSDQANLLALYNDPLVAVSITHGFLVPTSAECVDNIMKMVKDSLMFCILEEINSGAFVGFTLFLPVRDHKDRNATWGIALAHEHWHKGYGGEAANFMVDYAFRHLASHRVTLTVVEGNERAVALYKRIGFVEEGRTRKLVWVDGGWQDLIQMGILDEEWSQRQK
ncbi:hypothetical protein H0H81_005504 [Sphagnurus paluster]|uniref:N-acetyltransferase domain-containing protein n=1 Tax=Sphagnurus paluster TaxID=117069 RepID=A0A9P7GQD0_9AGAR|nr:hypothetical protein H0H81_005504 [Sphagnurus paluster]